MVRQTSKWGQIFLLSLIGLGSTTIVTSWVYRIDEVITAQGRLVPYKGGVEVKSPLNGQLSSLSVKNGETVEKGQVLMRFDTEAAKAEEVTLKREIDLEKKGLKDTLEGNRQRQKTLLRNIDLSKRILERMMPLESIGAISELQILGQENKLETQRDELQQLKNQETQIINASRVKTTRANGQLKIVQSRLKNETIKAPVSGIAFNIKPDNNNYVTTIAEPLLSIIPNGKFVAEVNIGNRDIGFIKEGQKVKVRIDSFPYTEYGEIDGTVTDIGADALPPNETVRTYHFPVGIDLKTSSLKTRDGIRIPLKSGMTITTNLKLRDRRLIELISDLFTDKGESLKRLRQP